MSEPTLSLKKSDYLKQVGLFMGWGTGDPPVSIAWTAAYQNELNFLVASGLRRFYFCSPPYDWSFLKPQASIAIAAAQKTVTLPDDFGGVEGSIAVASSDSSVFAPIEFNNPGRVQQLYSEYPTLTGRIRIASIRPVKAIVPGKGQQSELFVFPSPDAAYTLQFAYYINPDYLLDAAQPYAYGGAEHSETILESCLAVAEERRDDMQGVHRIAFQERLVASMAMDRRKKPQRIGYNRDCSDNQDVSLTPGRGMNWSPVTYNGVEMS